MSHKNLEEEIISAKGQWFAINCQTGHEEKVMADLIQKIKTSNLESEVYDVRISKFSTLTPKGKETEKNKFPGYIFINMIMSERAWFIVRNTPGVTGFIGSSGRGAKPFPLTIDEVIRMLTPEPVVAKIEEEAPIIKREKGVAVAKKELKTAPFAEGDIVLIKEGPYANEEGPVISMDYSKGVAIISIEMFGRYTPAEVAFENIASLKEK
ncbi:transcription termination/antitermination protein NusG [Williamsoniiplasma somnilux]|uniref:Transcription termination/antitermination protein NusG n=1 Tax=Williamsoniiplasma somnilux TaxID=215578 RepID=A0A2K8P231_9MOLU|nr:transcription termination/antitermination protein NusG [Williamsoniiplasma somnilux]ATZ19071.1 transcription termination/antitermination protein NusG [Williamsoniiplasma somnilux]